MITWNYRVFRDKDRYCIREVFYLDNGDVGGYTEQAVTPSGATVESLRQNIEDFKQALTLPVLTLQEVDATIASQPRSSPPDVNEAKPNTSQSVTVDNVPLPTTKQLALELNVPQPILPDSAPQPVTEQREVEQPTSHLATHDSAMHIVAEQLALELDRHP